MARQRFQAASLCWITSVALLAGGCASLGSLERPELTLVDLQLTEATLFETTLQVQLRIANPNPQPLTFEGASFKLVLEERKVGRGMTPESLTVPRLGTEVLDVTFHVSNASVLLRLREILEQESVSYGVAGKLFLRQSLGRRKLKIRSSGQLDLGSLEGPAETRLRESEP